MGFKDVEGGDGCSRGVKLSSAALREAKLSGFVIFGLPDIKIQFPMLNLFVGQCNGPFKTVTGFTIKHGTC